MNWEAQLKGNAGDLQMLARSFTEDLPLRVKVNREGEFVMESHAFAALSDATEVRLAAIELTDILCGAAKLVLGHPVALTVGAVQRRNESGARDVFAFMEPGHIAIRGYPVGFMITRADGTVETHSPADEAVQWLSQGQADPEVAKALRLYRLDLDWPGVYRLLEVVEGAFGRPPSWWPTEDVKRLKHTANSVGAIGDDARHGRERTVPPRDPMTLSQAHDLVKSLIQKWLREH